MFFIFKSSNAVLYPSSYLTKRYSFFSKLRESEMVGPAADGWDNIIVGMKVEVENSDAAPLPGVFHTAFWVATVLRISGYKVATHYLLF